MAPEITAGVVPLPTRLFFFILILWWGLKESNLTASHSAYYKATNLQSAAENSPQNLNIVEHTIHINIMYDKLAKFVLMRSTMLRSIVSLLLKNFVDCSTTDADYSMLTNLCQLP